KKGVFVAVCKRCFKNDFDFEFELDYGVLKGLTP
ncbi:MAG: hypothetical protein XD53_1788, partial [Petrotoga mobilis]